MQKKFLAVAISLAISNIAIAETNVQIYGLVDYGYALRHDRLGDFKNPYENITNAKNLGYSKTNSRFDSGQAAGNRIGFKGEEDLGNGLKAIFLLEQGFNIDTGEETKGFRRQAYVGLSGNFGTLVGGVLYTPYYLLVSNLDPFNGGTVGAYQNLKEDISHRILGSARIIDPIRVKNAIAYISPNWNGFNFIAAYSNNAFDDDSSYRNASNNNVYAIAANYVAPNWNIGLSYHYVAPEKSVNYIRTVKNINNLTFGGAYDFQAVKVSAFISYDKVNATQNLPELNNKKSISQTNFMLGAVAPFGKHAVKGSFNYSHNSKNQFGKAWMLALGYDYNFSKRTNFYAAYSYINNDKANNNRLGRTNTVGDTTNSGFAYQQGFQLGIKHSF